MKIRISITASPRDSKEEINKEIKILTDIVGEELKEGYEDGSCATIYEGEFHELYAKIKDRIHRKLDAYK